MVAEVRICLQWFDMKTFSIQTFLQKHAVHLLFKQVCLVQVIILVKTYLIIYITRTSSSQVQLLIKELLSIFKVDKSLLDPLLFTIRNCQIKDKKRRRTSEMYCRYAGAQFCTTSKRCFVFYPESMWSESRDESQVLCCDTHWCIVFCFVLEPF